MIDLDNLRSMFDAVAVAVGTLEDNDKKLSDLLVKQGEMQVVLAKSVSLLATEIDKINKNEVSLLSKIEELNSIVVDVGEWKEENI
tara:strand:- start:53 stop:310 length:258 start_codon:yes stop_codon:yes gene_type:complete